MAAFSSAFLADSVFTPNDPVKNPCFLDEFFPDFDQFYASSGHQPLFHQVGSSINASANESSCLEQQSNSYIEPLVTGKQRSESESFTSMADKADSGDQVTQIWIPFDKKRKSNHGSPSNSTNSKEVKQVKCKKQKGSKEAIKGVKNEKNGEEEQASEEPPKGYIHVRARRGQATDSHSLAERARREKISQKMKTLQALVPGCDKVTGKALMLDEIINYVQSLQNQVEFLSMKLASVDPMVYVFGLMDHEAATFGTEEINNAMALPIPSMQSANHSNSSSPANSSLAFTNINLTTNSAITTTTTATATFASPVVDSSASLFEHEQKPIISPQDARSLYWGLDDLHQQSMNNQFGYGANNNLYSF